jgi:CheY-like chemotaxis protein
MPDAKRVLVVDDEEDVRVVVARLLEKAGCVVETASDGEAAVAAVLARKPDLLVLDLAMPGLDGWSVIARLKPSGPPPIVLLASEAENPKDGPFQDCIVGYLFKPLHYGELAAACKRVLAAKAPSADVADRRRHPRRLLLVDVTLLSRDGSPAVNGRLVDLSERGLQMEMDAELAIGDKVRVVLHVPGPSAQLGLDGRVLRRAPADRGFAYGIGLDEMTAEEARQLRTVLEPRSCVGG